MNIRARRSSCISYHLEDGTQSREMPVSILLYRQMSTAVSRFSMVSVCLPPCDNTINVHAHRRNYGNNHVLTMVDGDDDVKSSEYPKQVSDLETLFFMGINACLGLRNGGDGGGYGLMMEFTEEKEEIQPVRVPPPLPPRCPISPSYSRHGLSLAVNEGGENVGGALPSAAVAVVSASHRDFSGDVLLVDAGGDGAATSGAVLLRATAAGKDVFEVKVRKGGGNRGTLMTSLGRGRGLLPW